MTPPGPRPALVALVLTLQPVSAAFNPVITLVERWAGAIGWAETAALVGAQLVGGVLGSVLANLTFELPAVSIAQHARSGPGVWLGEVVATFGLVLVVFGALRSGRQERVAYAVGGYIAAAYWFTSSTSFANPAVTLAPMFSDSFAGIAPASVLPFLGMQLAGGLVAAPLLRVLYPATAPPPPGARTTGAAA
jgi:glycerol uptake facilitator-like aquaporin